MLVRLSGEAQSSFNSSLNIVLLILMNYFSMNAQAYTDFMVDTGFESTSAFGAKGGDGLTYREQRGLKKMQMTDGGRMHVSLASSERQNQTYVQPLSDSESLLYGLQGVSRNRKASQSPES